MIVIIDYGCGNLFSLGQALNYIGVDYHISDDLTEIRNAGALLLPGVGAFGDAMKALRDKKLDVVIHAAALAGTPIFGICLGMQLLFEQSDEFGQHTGLGLIKGNVVRLPESNEPNAIRIPNVGWRPLNPRPENPFGNVLDAGKMMYFVHSYAAQPTDAGEISATISVNGEEVAVAVNKGNIYGCQFHPEKSAEEGLKILQIFTDTLNLTPKLGNA